MPGRLPAGSAQAEAAGCAAMKGDIEGGIGETTKRCGPQPADEKELSAVHAAYTAFCTLAGLPFILGA